MRFVSIIRCFIERYAVFMRCALVIMRCFTERYAVITGHYAVLGRPKHRITLSVMRCFYSLWGVWCEFFSIMQCFTESSKRRRRM